MLKGENPNAFLKGDEIEMKKNAGFTLMELMVVIAIIGIISAIATPNVISWLSTQKLNSAAREIQSTIQDIRVQSIKNRTRIWLELDNAGNDYFLIQEWKNGSTHTTRKNLPAGVEITNVSFNGDHLGFNPRGFPITDDSGWTRLNQTGYIDLSNGETSLQLVISTSGSSRISG